MRTKILSSFNSDGTAKRWRRQARGAEGEAACEVAHGGRARGCRREFGWVKDRNGGRVGAQRPGFGKSEALNSSGRVGPR